MQTQFRDDIIRPPRWKSPLFWGFVVTFFAIMFYGLYYAAINSTEYIKRGNTPNGMATGWLVKDRLQDLSDQQWRQFRSQLPLLFIGAFVYLVISSLVKSISAKYLNDSRIPIKVFYLLSSIGFIGFLHGAASFWLFAVVTINFIISRVFRESKLNPIVTWAFCITALVSAYVYDGFSFHAIFGDSFAWLDSHHGILHWETYFKITFCRLISFNVDYCWALRQHNNVNIDDQQIKSSSSSTSKAAQSAYRQRVETAQPISDYNFLNYIIYLFYIPLYIAGPIITFNDFCSQVKVKQTEYQFTQIAVIVLRACAYAFALEVLQHYFYYYAFNEHRFWITLEMPPWEVAVCGMITLQFTFLKFLVIWRLFRAWALFDGIEAPENLLRCISNNNFTFTDFWRHWHASLNKWTVRYLYRGLGGRSTQLWNIWVVFLFIGLWHDLWWRWVAWALLNCACFSVEILIRKYFAQPKFDWLWQAWYYHHLLSALGAVNMLLIILANVAIIHGFHTIPFTERLLLRPGSLKFIVVCEIWLFCGVQMGLEIEEEKKRRAQRQQQKIL